MIAVCRVCAQDFSPPAGRIKRRDWICTPCRNAKERARLAPLRAAGVAIKVSRGDPEKRLAREHDYLRRPEVKKRRAAAMAGYAKNPELRERHRARWQVRRAVKAGTLVKAPCEVCGAERVEGHHDDYSKPLAVRWLCTKHHREHHARAGGAK